MYKTVFEAHRKYLYGCKTINLHSVPNIDTGVWLSIKDISFSIIKDGILYDDKIILWDSFDDNKISHIISQITESKKLNPNDLDSFKEFCKYVAQNKILHTTITLEDEALELLKICYAKIQTIDEKLNYYGMVAKNLNNMTKKLN